MIATTMEYGYQVSDHGCGRYSVQCFGGENILDETIIRDVNGYRRLASETCFSRPEELAAVIFADYAGLTLCAGEWPMIDQKFRSRV